jgi:hypothetical protein
MATAAETAFKQADLYSDDERYRFVKLPIQATTVAAGIIAEVGTPFMALLVDKDEISMMLEADAYDAYSKRLLDSEASATVYRLLTFDIELEPTLTGFMALISRILADAGISIMPFAAYSRDHIFIPEAQFEQALNALHQHQSQIS